MFFVLFNIKLFVACFFRNGIVHPGIDVHFDIAFLNDHCGKVLNGRDFKLFGNVEN